MIDETRSYTAAVRAQQDAGAKAIEMTEDMVNLYNPVVWATALVAAVLIEIRDIPLAGDNQPGESPERAKFN